MLECEIDYFLKGTNFNLCVLSVICGINARLSATPMCEYHPKSTQKSTTVYILSFLFTNATSTTAPQSYSFRYIAIQTIAITISVILSIIVFIVLITWLAMLTWKMKKICTHDLIRMRENLNRNHLLKSENKMPISKKFIF